MAACPRPLPPRADSHMHPTCRTSRCVLLFVFCLVTAAPALAQDAPACPLPDASQKESYGVRFQYYPVPVIPPELPCAGHALLVVWPADAVAHSSLDEPAPLLVVVPADGVAKGRPHAADDPPEVALDSVPFEPGAWSSSLDIRPALEQRAPVGFDWNAAFRESFLFLAVQHSFRVGMEPDTRTKLNGRWFHEWFASATTLRGWRDGDNFVTNYVAHPMQGAVTGFIYVQNDPNGRAMTFTPDKQYFKNRTKTLLWSAVWSTQFEMGPISESSIGNVGYRSLQKRYNSFAYVDLVITPTLGTAWLVGEDAVDRYFIRKWEERTENRVARAALRSFLNPSRSFANMMRGRWPWHRDTRAANP